MVPSLPLLSYKFSVSVKKNSDRKKSLAISWATPTLEKRNENLKYDFLLLTAVHFTPDRSNIKNLNHNWNYICTERHFRYSKISYFVLFCHFNSFLDQTFHHKLTKKLLFRYITYMILILKVQYKFISLTIQVSISIVYCILLLLRRFENNAKSLLAHVLSTSILDKHFCIKYIAPKVFEAYATLNKYWATSIVCSAHIEGSKTINCL